MDTDPDPGKEIEVDPDPGLKWIRIRPNAVDPDPKRWNKMIIVKVFRFYTKQSMKDGEKWSQNQRN